MGSHEQIGRRLASFIRDSGDSSPSINVLVSVIADLAADTPEIASPLIDLVNREVFQNLVPYAGSSNASDAIAKRDAIISEISDTYHPRVVNEINEVLTGFLELSTTEEEISLDFKPEPFYKNPKLFFKLRSPQTIQSVNNATACAVIILAMGSAAMASLTLISTQLKRPLEIYLCKSKQDQYTPFDYIVRSGPEYLLVDSNSTWSRNSFIASKEIKDIPLNWKFKGMNIAMASWQGFRLEAQATNATPIIKEVSFDSKTKKVAITYNKNNSQSPPKDFASICKEEGNLLDLKQVINNVPLGYLQERTQAIAAMRPNLHHKSFNQRLIEEIQSKNNSDYSHYQLLNMLRESDLTLGDKEDRETLRESLIDSNSSTQTIWEFSGSGSFMNEPQFPNERQAAYINGMEWCKNQEFGNRSQLMSEGYKEESVTSQTRDGGGWLKKIYPDNSYGGYVKYQAICNGTQTTFKLKGSVDTKNENSYSY